MSVGAGILPAGMLPAWERAIRMGSIRVWAAIAVGAFSACLLVSAAADEPEAWRFPYAELAALAAAVAPVEVSFTLERDVAMRLRPAVNWPVVARLDAGDEMSASAITGGLDPWVLVGLSGGASGWVRLADTTWGGAPPRLPRLSAAPIRARPANEYTRLYVSPGGAGRGAGRSWLWADDPPLGVAGRSPDGQWVALRVYSTDGRWEPEVVWAPAAEFELIGVDAAVSDLPIFVGRETSLIPVDGGSELEPATLPAADEWAWTAEGWIVGVAERGIWRYDPSERRLETYPRPKGNATLAPDGRHIAVASCSNLQRECGKPDFSPFAAYPFDIVIVPTDGGASVRVRDVHSPLLGWKFGTPYQTGEWSPDGATFLTVMQVWRDGWPDVGAAWSVIQVDGRSATLPRFSDGPNEYWVWLADGTLLWNEWSGGEALWIATHEGVPLRSVALPGAVAEVIGYNAWFRTRYMHPWSSLKWAVRSADAGGWQLFDLATGAIAPLQISQPSEAFAEAAEGRRFAIPFRRDQQDALLLFDGGSGAAAILPLSTGGALPPGEFSFAPSGPRLLLRDGVRLQVVDVASGAAADVDLRIETEDWNPSGAHGYVCGGGLNWSPDGERFTVEIREFHEQQGGEWYRRDGLAAFAFGEVGSQIQVYDRSGEFVRAFRTLGAGPHSSAMMGEWSPDGRWLAIGGHSLWSAECSLEHE